MRMSKRSIGLAASIISGTALFLLYQNMATSTVTCNDELCEQILRAIQVSRSQEVGLSNSEIVQHAANRLGYGLSPVGGLQPTNVDRDKIVILARTIASQAKSPRQFSEHVTQVANKIEYKTTEPGVFRINIFNQNTEQVFGVLADAAQNGERRDISGVKKLVSEAQTDAFILQALLGSQGVHGVVVDYQVNLRSVLHEFWYNHFNVDTDKARIFLGGNDGYDSMIHNKMYTSFEQLLNGVITHPAMLAYLDNQNNRMVAVEGSGTRRIASNQNLGRELLELHTLGVGPRAAGTASPYTQTDVEESSKILAGVNVRQGFYRFNLLAAPRNSYCQVTGSQRVCVDETPTVMNVRYSAEGEQRLRTYLRDLSRHERTKRNICGKLVMHFSRIVSADGDRPVLERCLAAWGESGNLRAMYAAILTSPEFWSKTNFKRKLKNPVELVFSQIRASGLSFKDLENNPAYALKVARTARAHIGKMGLDYRRYADPTGYKQNGPRWLSSGYLAQAVTLGFNTQYILESAGADLEYRPGLEASLERLSSQPISSSGSDIIDMIYNDIAKMTVPNFSLYQRRSIATILADEDMVHKFYPQPREVTLVRVKTATDLISSQYSFLLK